LEAKSLVSRVRVDHRGGKKLRKKKGRKVGSLRAMFWGVRAQRKSKESAEERTKKGCFCDENLCLARGRHHYSGAKRKEQSETAAREVHDGEGSSPSQSVLGVRTVNGS